MDRRSISTDAGATGRRSRRSLLSAAAGVAGVATTATVLGAFGVSDATAGSSPMLLDTANTGSSTTGLNANFQRAALRVTNRREPSEDEAPGAGIAAYVGPKPPTEPGSTALYAENSAAALGNQATYGIQGRARGVASTGVLGFSDGGVGVMGAVNGRDGDSVGVWGDLGGRRGSAGKFTAGPAGRALETIGRLAFSQAASATVPAGKDSIVIEEVHAGHGSLALVTLQGAPAGIHVVSAEIRRTKRVAVLEIHLSANAPAGGLTAGYLIVDAL